MITNLKIRLQNYYIIIIIVGFLASSIIPSIFGIGINLNIIYRACIVFFSSMIILINLSSLSLKKQFLLLLLFLLLYLLSVVFDLYINQIRLWPTRTPLYYLQYLIGAVIFPVLALVSIDYKVINFDFILNGIYIILFILLLLSINLRIESSSGGRDVGDLDIGVLLYGQYGATMCILSMYQFFTTRRVLTKLLYSIGYLVGFLAIFISASRSPLLALFLVTIVFVLTRTGKTKALFFISFLGLLIYFFFIDILSFIGTYINSNFLDRIIYALEGVSTGRQSLFQTAFMEFVDAPFLGSAFLIQTGNAVGIYPHNLIIEAFMALGFIGGILFLIIILKNIKKVFIILNAKSDKYVWIGLLYLQFLIFGMFSGSLYTSDFFWVYTVLIVGVSIQKDNLKISKNEN